jgi:putative acetyltransferase
VSGPVSIRPVRDEDGAPVAALIAACFAEYENCPYNPEEFPELQAPAAWYAPKGTRMWVAEAAGDIVGCICGTPRPSGDIELHKFYVAAPLRGSGLADRLHGLVEALATGIDAPAIVLWSDVRFARAHRFYEKRGYRRTGETRDMFDYTEAFFRLDRAPAP